LYPEGIDYNPVTDKFIVGSFREGAVYEISLDGTYRQIINDDRLSSVLAVRVDVKRNKLFVVNSDIGASIRRYSNGPKKLASLEIYELSSGKAIHFIGLGKLLPKENHLANGMTLDANGLVIINDQELVVIANRASGKVTETVFTLKSTDNWTPCFILRNICRENLANAENTDHNIRITSGE